MINFLRNLSGLISARISLLLTELGQIKTALVYVLLWGIGAILFASFGLISASTLFVIYAWPTIGLWSLVILTGFYWLIATVFVLMIWRLVVQDKLRLKITLEELRLDREALFPKDSG